MKLRRGKTDETAEPELDNNEKTPRQAQGKKKLDRDEGSRYAALWLMILTILLSLGFWFWGSGLGY